MIAVGIVVNPKLRTPVVAFSAARGITISRLDDEDWTDIGEGYYAEDHDVTRATGLVRVHTPHGVEPKGEGYGTSLYTALCLGATMPDFLRKTLPDELNRGRFELGPRHDYDGVASQPGDRSREAEAWWKRARKFDLTSLQDFSETEEGVDVSSDVEGCLQEYEGGSIVSVSATADVERSMEADVYPFSNAEDAGIIIARFAFDVTPGGSRQAPDPGALWKLVREKPAQVRTVYRTPLLALDVRGLDLDAINLLGMLAKHDGATDEDLDHLRLRWDLGLDPEVPITQMRLPFKPNGPEARAAEEAVLSAAEARSRVGWARLAELP